MVDCQCECGEATTVRQDEYENDRILSCGCLRIERTHKNTGFRKKIDEDLLIKYYNQKLTSREIAKYLECSPVTVVKRLHKLGLFKREYRKSNNKNWKGYGDISGGFWSEINLGAKGRELEFSITIEYAWELFLKQNKKCALSGIELDIITRRGKTASLDRIDSKIGYVEGNVQWLHKDINRMKQIFGQDYFVNTCIKIADLYRMNNLVLIPS